MTHLVKAVAITAGGIAAAAALVMGFSYGMLIGIINDDPQEDL